MRAWVIPEPAADPAPATRWAGELTSPFVVSSPAPDAEPAETERPPFSVDGELLAWAAELAQVPGRVRDAFGRLAATEAVGHLVDGGARDEEWLTNLVFHARHRELGGRTDPGLTAEWQAIRDEEVRPLLEAESGSLIGNAIRNGLARNAVRTALAGGETGENALTDAGYRAAQLGSTAKIKAGDPPELRQRWLHIRDDIVRPLLREKRAGLDRLVPRGKPFPRACCVLFGPDILELGTLGTHGTTPVDALGELYTRKLGFVDLGHARETADVTLWVLTQLQAHATRGSTIELFSGKATLLRDVPADRRLGLAQQLAYVDSVEHEIVTFGVQFPGMDNSSFSPEDLPSNLFGTMVAAAAFRADGGSDAAITQQFTTMLTAAGAQPEAVGRQVQQAAANRGWWGAPPAGTSWVNSPLRKRNLTADPWLIDEAGTVRIGTGALPKAPPLTGPDFEYTSRTGLKNTEFAQKIAVIRTTVGQSAVTP